MINYNPNGGDLGRANIRSISALELQVIIPHIADILSELAIMKISDLPFKYAFELHKHERDMANLVIQGSINKLPSEVSWYELDGRKLFDMRGQSGGIVSSIICYLVTKEKR
jgi:hypothetical protein